MPGPYVNLGMRSFQLPFEAGQSPKGSGREKWDVEDNASPSVLDPVFQTAREVQDSKNSPLTIKIKTTLEAAVLTDKCGRIVLSREAIGDHMEERISSFLMQIIDCYDSEYHFTVGKTQDQTKSTPAIHFKLEPGVAKPAQGDFKMTFASAHHGTLPCIYAYPRAAWEAWKAKNNPNAPGKPEPKVYAYKSDTYYLNNACTGLSTIINQADIDLDGNPTETKVEFGPQKGEAEKKLREFTIDLLNRAAKKEITPVQGFGLYMAKLKTLVKELNESNPTEEKKLIFSAWNEDIEALDLEYQGNYKWFIARLIGLNIPNQDRDTINLEAIVFPRHFKLLQKKNLYQTQLALQVDQLKNTLLGKEVKRPKNFDKAFKLALMKAASVQDEKIRTIFQRYYNCSGKSLETLQRECEQTCNPALKVVNKKSSQEAVADFFLHFSHYVHNLKIDEIKFSSSLAKEIRTVQGLSLRTFSKKYNAMFPRAHPLNHEQLRRIEYGCVEVSKGMIGRIAKVLNIHESVLMTQFA